MKFDMQLHSNRRHAFYAFVLVCLASLTPTTQAQTYKWVGADGKTVYSDRPPPANAKLLANTKGSSSSNAISVNLPPELAAAVNKNPIIFYTAPACKVCDEARSLLKSNGIPFAEKTIVTMDDVEALKQASGDTQLPCMIINRSKFIGLDKIEWRTVLSKAGYPETNMLPKEYAYPQPEPAAPPKLTEKKNKDEPVAEPLKPRSSSPTGIRF